MVRDRLNEDDVEIGCLLDGNPRTTAQVDYLDAVLAAGGLMLDIVLQLTANDEELGTVSWAVPRKPAAATTTKPSSATSWTFTTSRPKPWWPSMPSAAS